MAQTGTQAFEDSDDSIYKTHILYVLAGDENCRQLERQLANHPIEPVTWIQDVRKLAHPLPSWLKGVPTLLCKQERHVHMGRNIQTYLNKVLDSCNTEEGDGLLLPGSDTLSAGLATSQFGMTGGAALGAPGAYSLEYDKSPDEISTATVSNGSVFRSHMGASYDAPGVFQNASPSAGGSTMAPSASMMNPPQGARDRRRQHSQNEHAERLQAMRDARDAQDRRLNPSPHYQR